MRYTILAVVVWTAGMATASLAEDSYFQPMNRLDGYPAFSQNPNKPSYEQCFQLGWVRGVHVERGEWDDFYEQCAAGEVPFESGKPVDSVKLHRAKPSPHS